MSQTNESKMDFMHQLATGVGISPASTSYTMSVKDFLNQLHAILNYELGIDIAELNVDTGSEDNLRIFLNNPSFPVAGPDSKPWPLCELLQEHHGYPVFSDVDFASELTGRLFKANRLFVEQVTVSDDWNDVFITISAKPRDRYFLVINPSQDHYLYGFRYKESTINQKDLIELWDDEPQPIEVWRRDALEISKTDYVALSQKEAGNWEEHKKVALAIMDKYLNGRDYRYFFDINPNSGQYREIYSVSPMQKVTDTYIEAFDSLRGDLKWLERDQNYPLNMDYCELSSEEYDRLLDVAINGGVDSEAYIQATEKIILDRLPVYQNLSRRDIFGMADSFTFWHSLYEGEDTALVQEGFLAYLLANGQGSAVEMVLNRIASNTPDYEELIGFLKDWAMNQKREHPQEFTSEQKATLNLFKQALSEIIDHCADDSFYSWLTDQNIFSRSADEILNGLLDD